VGEQRTLQRTRLAVAALTLLAAVAFGTLSSAPLLGQRSQPPDMVQSASTARDVDIVLPPAWAFGLVYGAYTNQAESDQLVRDIIAHDYPIDGFWIDSWFWDWKNQGRGPERYMDFVGDKESYPNLRGLWSMMERESIKAGIWVWDAIFEKGNESAFGDFKSRGLFSQVYFRTDSWHNGSRTTIIGDNSKPVSGTTCGDIDFKNPEAVRHFKARMKPFFDAGLDFVKLDKTDDVAVCKAMFDMTRELGLETRGRGFILSHSGGTSVDEFKRYPAKWTDDTRSDWSAKAQTREFSPWLPAVGFKENVEMYLDVARPFHRIPFLTNDLGGFAVSTDGFVDEELYLRWLEFSMLLPVTTPFSQPENRTGNIAFKISPRADRVFRDYSHLKMELFPYIYTYAHRARLDGVGIVRPLSAAPPTYLLGDELLVAPVIEQGVTERRVAFPSGSTWFDFQTDATHAGGTTGVVSAPADRLPLFVKAGALIPRRKYARAIERGTNGVLELHVYAGADGTFELIEDDGTSEAYLRGEYATTRVSQRASQDGLVVGAAPRRGHFAGMGGTREWQVVIHGLGRVTSIDMDGRTITHATADGRIVIPPFRRPASQSWSLRLRTR
jgi:alpha-glucosidase (family GH31 glycosyl hydrolase)